MWSFFSSSKGDNMQKSILIGNGINIQFGGFENYSNTAILKRMFRNIRAGKYCPLFPDFSISEQLGLFEDLRDILVNNNRYHISEASLFQLMEIDRVRKQYDDNTDIEHIGMEDYFLALEYAFKERDSVDFIRQVQRELKMPLIDAIYNDGDINGIDYGPGFGKYISSFDNVFTLNYDSNLDRYRDDVNHLHGEFSKLALDFNLQSEYSVVNTETCMGSTVLPEYSHMYSNTVMSWYWLEKYGILIGNGSDYGIDKFQHIEGKLDIVGMSPCNDEHLFLAINQSRITSVDYYYYSEEDIARMKSKIMKPMTFRKVEKLWTRIK